MKTITQLAERRRSPRFEVQGMAIAVARPPSLPPGHIKEVSQSGLTFQYRQTVHKWPVPQTLDIIWADYVATHHLEKLPVRVVSDVLIEPQGKTNESATYQLAVAFENLTPHQENQIDRLIDARGTVPL